MKIYWEDIKEINTDIIKLNFEIFLKLLDCYYGNIFITDGNGIVLYFNEAEWAKWGLSREKHLGKHVSYFLEKGYFTDSATTEVLKTKKKVAIRVKNYEGKDLLVYAVPIFNKRDEIIYTIHYSVRQEETEKFQEELRKSKETITQISSVLEYVSKNFEKGSALIAKNKEMIHLLQLARRVAKTDGAVLIGGESGTGKELLARYIFSESNRSDKVFLPINCAAIPHELMESEFFGYIQGSFTGANKNGKAGLFELADKGTIFLDEIGELPLAMQSKLLRVLESGEVIRIGAANPIKVNVRIIAASNRNIKNMVQEKTFREDLYYRLNVVPLEIPPLRQRKEDILLLADHFLNEYNAKYKTTKKFSSRCENMFINYSWPGNVRELKNMIHRMVITTDQNNIEPIEIEATCPLKSVQEEINENYIDGREKLKVAMQKYEQEYIRKAIIAEGGNISKAAEALGVSRSYIYRKLDPDKCIKVY